MAIYNIPTATSTINTIGTKSNPIYKESMISSSQHYINRTTYNLIDYSIAYKDFRKLYAALTGTTPKLTAKEAIRLEATFPSTKK